MTARFMKGITMEAPEAEMQRIPGFGSRKSGIIRSWYSLRDLKGANCPWEEKKTLAVEKNEAFYQSLLQLLAAELPEGTFLVRVMKLQNRCETERVVTRLYNQLTGVFCGSEGYDESFSVTELTIFEKQIREELEQDPIFEQKTGLAEYMDNQLMKQRILSMFPAIEVYHHALWGGGCRSRAKES